MKLEGAWTGSNYVRYEVLTVSAMKLYVFWDITMCSQLKVKRRFGGTCHLCRLED
jgi:hypothetical protein